VSIDPDDGAELLIRTMRGESWVSVDLDDEEFWVAIVPCLERTWVSVDVDDEEFWVAIVQCLEWGYGLLWVSVPLVGFKGG